MPQVGEWRGFLSPADREYIEQLGLNQLMYSAYLCTTLSTVVAMVASFLGSQHTFCFLQLRAEEHSASKMAGQEDEDSAKARVDEDGLNLKTPGPKPHPSWVYRHHFSAEERKEVQRSLSMLQHMRATNNRVELLGSLPKLATRELSPLVMSTPHPPHLSTISDKVDAGTMRHAIIRRHNSMYAASTRTIAEPFHQPPYKLQNVSGASEVRPIVTLQRSKTSVNLGSTVHYRATSLQGVTRSYSTAPQFRQYASRYRVADVPLHGTVGRYKKNPTRSSAVSRHVSEKTDQFCEFQAGSSFDLPDLATLQRAAQSQSPEPWQQGGEEHKYSAVLFETEDGKTTSKSSRLMRDGESSGSENIRYQAMDVIKKDTRVHRRNSTNTSDYNVNKHSGKDYGSWESLLERSEVQGPGHRRHQGQQYGSTGSLVSVSDTEPHQPRTSTNQMYQQAAGHLIQLHAIHNTSFQSTNSTLETCLESDENDLEDLTHTQL